MELGLMSRCFYPPAKVILIKVSSVDPTLMLRMLEVLVSTRHGNPVFFFLKSIGGRSRNVPFVYKDEALSPRCYLLFSVFLLPSTSSTTSFSQRYLLSISYKAYLSEQKNRGVARSDISLRRIFLKEIHPLKRQSLHHESYKSHIRGDRHRLCSC